MIALLSRPARSSLTLLYCDTATEGADVVGAYLLAPPRMALVCAGNTNLIYGNSEQRIELHSSVCLSCCFRASGLFAHLNTKLTGLTDAA